jgi:hypothetical protein
MIIPVDTPGCECPTCRQIRANTAEAFQLFPTVNRPIAHDGRLCPSGCQGPHELLISGLPSSKWGRP